MVCNYRNKIDIKKKTDHINNGIHVTAIILSDQLMFQLLVFVSKQSILYLHESINLSINNL